MTEEEVKEIQLDASSPIANEPPVRSAGIISQLISIFSKFKLGQEMTSNSLSMPDGFEGKDTSIERLQAGTLKHSDILLKVNEIEDPVMRMIQVLKWKFTVGQGFQLKKPLNPVLGEVTMCKFYSNQPKEGNKNNGRYTKDDVDDDVFYSLAEQISHHPPISAFFHENKKQGISLNAYSKASIRFMGTAVKLSLDGKNKITFDKFNEVYEFTPPAIMIRFVGFVLEYAGDCDVTCSNSPYVARVTYKEKPYLRGKYHAVKGTIVKVNGEKAKEGKKKGKEEEGKKKGKEEEEVVVKFKGHWDQEIIFEDLRNNQTYTFQASDYPMVAGVPIYPPLDLDFPQSSRKIWGTLKTAQDGSSISKAKKEVEEEQRRKAKERVEKGEEHVPKFFTQVEESEGGGWKPKPDVLQSIVF